MTRPEVGKKSSPSEFVLRIPPQAIEVEKHVLGALFLDGAHGVDEATREIQAADFYLEKHQAIFRACESLQASRSAIDLMTVSEELKRQGTFERIGGDGFLMEISAEVVSSANIRQHAQIIKQKAVAREVISRATRILELAYGDSATGPELVEMAEQEMYRAAESVRGSRRGLVDMPTAVLRMARQLDDVKNGKSNRTRIGVPAIDDIMKGFRIGSLNVLAARPSFGKSALALQAAIACGEPVPFFAMEMTIEEEIERLMAQIDSSLNGDNISTAAAVMAKHDLLQAVLKRIAKYPIEICDETDMTPSFMRSECRRMKRKHGKLGMVVADYLQIMKAEQNNHRRRDLEVGSVSGDLKRIAAELSAPMLAVASLSRKLEDRDNKRPIESDLREAGQIEYDAHSVILLYRHSKYEVTARQDERIKNVVEVIIPKNRGGKTGRTLMELDGAASLFHGMSMEHQTYYANFLAGKNFLGPNKKDGEAAPPKIKKGPKSGTPADDWGKQTAMLPETGKA